MELRQLVIGAGLVLGGTSPAVAGGLFVPGSGAVSMSRAGAAVASVDDGEAMGLNPAGFAKARGVTLTISATLIQYYMSFSRRGSYDPVTLEDRPYEGTPYPTVVNQPDPPTGIGGFQPLPVVVVSYNVPQHDRLTLAGGLYTPSGYPFRDMTSGYDLSSVADPDLAIAPPPTRYDVLTQESALLLPSLAAAYKVTPCFHVGARFTAGRIKSKTQVAVWGTPFNVEEDIRKDAIFTADVADGFIPAFGIGATYRPHRNVELGANYTSPVVIKAKGTAQSLRGPGNDPTRVIGPVPAADALCQPGGTMEQQRACISLQLPQTATIGGRYKFLDAQGDVAADVELDATWENWGKRCDYSDAAIVDSGCTSPGQYRVQIDAGLYNTSGTYAGKINSTGGANFQDLGLRDTFGLRLGGSYRLALDRAASGGTKLVVRGGLAYDTAAAKPGWLRANFDGADRVTMALGAAYEATTWELNAGLGYIHEGTNRNPGAGAGGADCNPTEADPAACGTTVGGELNGPDPTNPLLTPETQGANPYNQGSIRSHYLMFMLGTSKRW